MSTIHYWSDLHLGHEFVAKLRGFNSAAEHDAYIVETWQQHVRPEDQIWLLGDISGGRSEDHALDTIAQLNGRKHLIAGNHDSVASIHRNAWKQQSRFREVFASVQDFAKHRVSGTPFLLSHYPYAGDHGDRADRYLTYRLQDEGTPLVHGHVHDEWLMRLSPAETPMLNVGVERAPAPITLTFIDQWLKGHRTAPLRTYL